MSEESKFAAVLRQRRDETEEAEDTQTELLDPQNSHRATKRKRGRPSGGKRSNPEYEQTTIYLPRILHADVKIALVREGRNDFSELVEELMTKWLKGRRNSG